jgi:hypothetical protein
MNRSVLLIVAFLLLPAALAGQGSNDAGTVVQGADADFYCTFEIPDSLGLNALETDVEPNPFHIRYSMKRFFSSVIPAAN